MAKYPITYSCGHNGTVVLFGRSADREQRLKWYESVGLCPECYAAQCQQKREIAGQIASLWADAQGIPPLTGTDKQIAWAEVIRYERLTVLGDYASRVADYHAGNAELMQAFEDTLAWIGQQAEAKWWIDRRELSLRQLLCEAPAFVTVLRISNPEYAKQEEERRQKEEAAAAAKAAEVAKKKAIADKKAALEASVGEEFGVGCCFKVWDRKGDRRVYITLADTGNTIEYYHTGTRYRKAGEVVTDRGLAEYADRYGIDTEEAKRRVREFCAAACTAWVAVEVRP